MDMFDQLIWLISLSLNSLKLESSVKSEETVG
jgi:hypothetical protein